MPSAEETAIAEPFAVEAFGIDGAMFTAEPDPETNFKLFGPVPAATSGAETACRAFALRLRPNQDVATALENFCRGRGITRAKIHGGVGSTIGARFTDGRTVEPFATELAISSGIIAPGASALEAELDIALVDHTGGLAEGRLVRGDHHTTMMIKIRHGGMTDGVQRGHADHRGDQQQQAPKALNRRCRQHHGPNRSGHSRHRREPATRLMDS